MKSLFILSQILLLISTGSLIWLTIRAFRRHFGWGLAVMLLSPFTAILFAVRHWDDARKPFLVYIGSFFSGFALFLYVFLSWGGLDALLAAKQVAQGIQNKTLTDADARRFMEANVNFIENAADSEQDRAVVGVMRKFMRLSDSGFTEDEQRELTRDILDLLDRSDLTDEEREKLQELRRRMQNQEGGKDPSGKSFVENVKELVVGAAGESPDPETSGGATPDENPARFVSVPVNRAQDHVGSSVIVATRDGRSQQCALVRVSGKTLYFEKHISGGSIAFEIPSSEIQSLKVLSEY